MRPSCAGVVPYHGCAIGGRCVTDELPRPVGASHLPQLVAGAESQGRSRSTVWGFGLEQAAVAGAYWSDVLFSRSPRREWLCALSGLGSIVRGTNGGPATTRSDEEER